MNQQVYTAAREAFDISYEKEAIRDEFLRAAQEMQRPSAIYRPTLSADGSMWCALLGENLQEGVAGFGETPEAAMAAFDKAFKEERTPTARRLARMAEEERREEAAANGRFGVGA